MIVLVGNVKLTPLVICQPDKFTEFVPVLYNSNHSSSTFVLGGWYITSLKITLPNRCVQQTRRKTAAPQSFETVFMANNGDQVSGMNGSKEENAARQRGGLLRQACGFMTLIRFHRCAAQGAPCIWHPEGLAITIQHNVFPNLTMFKW